MTIGANEHAILSQDSYVDRSKNVGKNPVSIDGVDYQVLDARSNPLTGYQGTVYRRVDTGEVVIAHRGTEKAATDIGTDAGMVLSGLNAQAGDAEAFTKHAIELAQKKADEDGKPLNITVTGHSLGGTLAELTAYKFHLHGETFNAYGAAGLMHGVPEGGSQVVNYVRATDVVSAASKHYGETRVVATAQDIDTLSHAGYRDEGSMLSPRNPIKAVDFGAHGIANFVPDAQGHSALDPENAARYRAHHAMVDRYRDDVLTARTIVSAKWEVPKAAYEAGQAAGHAAAEKLAETYKQVHEAASLGAKVAVHTAEHAGQQVKHTAQQAAHAADQAYDATRDAAIRGAQAAAHTAEQVGHRIEQGAKQAASQIGEGVHQAGQAVTHGAQVLGQQAHLAKQAISDGMSNAAHTLSHPGSWFDHKPAAPVAPVSLDHPSHPGHAMFQQGLQGVQQLNARHGIAPTSRDTNFAGALAVAATTQGLTRIDHVVLNDNATRAFAVQGRLQGGIEGIDQKLAHVETMNALNTPLAQSSTQWEQAAQQRTSEQARAQSQQIAQQPAPHHIGPSM
ncbi:Lipase (class 3) [Dyella sp. OK004]|uniref:XVIPCD domain-containing protein n=1 Tax=Dyella sp. OK004 TaxID=1855292 RepID=UPI0008EEDB2A|nr:XVIPCD domain-containing protein [Dyella sp. OK004]SFR90149.1 Lipase (class 3) [Dyella sp. OK004]